MQLFSNNASTTLLSSLTDSETSMVVTSGAGFSAISSPDFELVTLAAIDAIEIVKVTAKVGTTWTIERGQEGTTAQAWDAGSTVESRVTAGSMDGMMQSGSFADLLAFDHGGDARGPGSINLQTARGGDPLVASGDYSLAIGPYTASDGSWCCAIGGYGVTHGSHSTGIMATTFADYSISTKGFFAVPTDNWNNQNESAVASAMAVFSTPNFDLASPPVWQASTAYSHGQIVQPTTGGTVQYRVWVDWNTSTYIHNVPTSGTTEPTWPGVTGSVVVNSTDNAEWVGTDLSDGYETEAFPAWLEFWPTGIAFICQEYSAPTGTPTISVGTPSSPTLILNAATVGITAAGQVYKFTLPNPCPSIPEGDSILVTLDGAASAGVMAGRFIFTGAFVGTRSRT